MGTKINKLIIKQFLGIAFLSFLLCGCTSKEIKDLQIMNTWDAEGDIWDIKWLPNEEGFLVSVSGRDNNSSGVYLYDTQNGQTSKILASDRYGIAIDAQKGFILSFPYPFTLLEIRDLSNGQLIEEIADSSCNGGLFLSKEPDGNRVVVANTGGHVNLYTTLSIWDIQVKKCAYQFPRIDGLLRSLDMNKNGNLIAISLTVPNKQPDETWVIDINTKTTICQLSGGYSQFSPKQNTLVIQNQNSDIEEWNVEICEKTKTIPVGLSMDGYFAVSPDERSIITIDETTRIWNIDSANIIWEGERPVLLNEMYHTTKLISFSPNGNYMVAILSEEVSGKLYDVVAIWEVKY